MGSGQSGASGLPPSDRFVFVGVLVVALFGGGFFFWSCYGDTKEVLNRVQQSAVSAQTQTQALLAELPPTDRMQPLAVLAALEIDTVVARNSRAASLLVTRTWAIFITTYAAVVMILIGSAFILGRIDMAASSASAEKGSWKGALTSSSPGLFLAFFGAALLTQQYWARTGPTTTDGAAYGIFYVSGAPDGTGSNVAIISPYASGPAASMSPPPITDEDVMKRLEGE